MEGKSPESRTTEGTWDGNELFPHQLKADEVDALSSIQTC